ncbi:phosphatidylethanolamine-binding protein domain-containing protein [Ditylenchus destructor]|uniref:Phosphatidylethanolamine-binding protein domain-containing protein n=1 Tax=Ditylenchus destructor TaxID=166010 RepID=A0AAD4MXQ4_9BILA|nr:phosphatidylethanolamine-binding protein domain-containing protein [Ditylenchus destructor]
MEDARDSEEGLVLAISYFICIGLNSADTIKNKFDAYNITGWVVSVAPIKELAVQCGSVKVTPGIVLKPSKAENPPNVTWDTDHSLHTLVMIDPDVPAPDGYGWGPQFLHWLVVNIPENNSVANGDTVSHYYPPTPPDNSGEHRYILLVYKQNGTISTRNPLYDDDFNVNNYSKKYELGSPVLGNFFLASYEKEGDSYEYSQNDDSQNVTTHATQTDVAPTDQREPETQGSAKSSQLINLFVTTLLFLLHFLFSFAILR